MFCSKCGTKVQENSKFCPQCGGNLFNSSEIKKEPKSEEIHAPEVKSKLNKYKVIIWSVVIFLIVFLIALSVYDLILYGLGLSPKSAGLLSIITAGVLTGWYYVTKNKKMEIKNMKGTPIINPTKENMKEKKKNNWILFSIILLIILLINGRFIFPDLIKLLDSFQLGNVAYITAVVGRLAGELIGSLFLVFILYYGINKINFTNNAARKSFISGLIVILCIIIPFLLFFIYDVIPGINSIDNNKINSNSVPANPAKIEFKPIQNVNTGAYIDEKNKCNELGDKYINEKSLELVRDWDGKYYKQTFKNITIDYSPKLNTCLVMSDVCNQNNICFIRIYALSEKYNSCNLSGDDPTREQAYTYFHYLITGEVLPELPKAYIQNIKSICNISL